MIRTGAQYIASLKDDRTVSVRPVQRGISTSEVIAVTRGLEAGERVVTLGVQKLEAGEKVRTIDEQ